MEPLLNVYKHIDAQAITVQAAILEEVTYGKEMMAGGEEAFLKAKQGAKWFSDWIGLRVSIDTTPAQSTAERVMGRAVLWQKGPRQAAEQRVLKLLAERLQVQEGNLGVLSTRLIEEAAAGFDISEDLLLSQQAEAVADRYLKDCLQGLQEQLKKQGLNEVKVTEAVMAEQISTLSPAQKLEMQRALNLDSLSASSLRSAFMNAAPIAGIAALQAGGFGSYLALTTVMHGVFTSMLGITLPFAAYTTATSTLSVLTGPVGLMLSLSVGFLSYFWGRRKIERSQYAMIVFTCVVHLKFNLVPKTETLPSARRYPALTNGKSGQIAQVPKVEEEDFIALTKEHQEQASARAVLQTALAEAKSAEERRRVIETALERTQEKLREVQARHSVDASTQAAQDLLIQQQRRRLEELQENLERAQQEKQLSDRYLGKLEQEASMYQGRYIGRVGRREKEIQSLWAIHYPRVDFRPQPLRWTAEQDFHARLEIERALRELADADDPVALSRSKMHATHEHHSRFTIPKGVECRMFYVVNSGRIEIRKLCKKKDC